jgi:hypothetical protein
MISNPQKPPENLGQHNIALAWEAVFDGHGGIIFGKVECYVFGS